MARVFTITEGLENMGALRTGGQGSVYKAQRKGTITTAVKILPTPIHSETGDDKHFAAFQNEVNKLKKVNEQPNPNVVKIMSSGITESGSFPFIEMEFIEGPDLEELLKPPGEPVFTIKETIKVAEQLANALAHCHKVGVKHGDIKSNNVKLNINTGNYVLLDFGLALMSDEQRRTSIRHAGAIEFMAPEQNEGQMLFETDVYSFGIILFELLAGVVPFPLRDKGETSRNNVMVAHMETAPPDLLHLRTQNLPEGWGDEKKAREMQVPDWLLKIIYRCLEKAPANRFANGTKLHEHLVVNSTVSANKIESAGNQLYSLQLENQRLLRERDALQKRLYRYEEGSMFANTSSRVSEPNTVQPVAKKGIPKWVYFLFLLIGLSALVYAVVLTNNKNEKEPEPVAENGTVTPDKPLRTIGQYKVQASRAHFHNEPDEVTRRGAYLVPSNDVVTGLDERNGFIYTEFTNSRGQTSKGWIRNADLVPLEEWLANSKEEKPEPRLTPEDITIQLADAKRLLDNNQVKEALYIYNYLSEQGVPEAMYHFGNLGLQKKNEALDCGAAFSLVEKASDNGHIPAKRTLGFLYLFADNREVLDINDYEQCTYKRNVFKGSKLLMEAVLGGDTTAKRLSEELNIETSIDSTEQE